MNLVINDFNSMDSIVRFFFVNSSTSITCWKVNSRRLLLCSVLSFKFKSIFFSANKKEDRSRLWWQDSVCEMLNLSLCSVLSLYILECSGVVCSSLILVLQKTTNHAGIHCLYY